MALADAVPYAVAHWALDESSGTRLDSVASTDLTDNNTVGVAIGKFGDGADFERDNSEYLSAADSSTLDIGTDDFMIRCWVKLESTGSRMMIVSKDVSADRQFFLAYGNTANRFSFQVVGAQVAANNFGAASTGVWYLVHAWRRYAGNEIGISVNAGTADTFTTTGTNAVGAAEFRIGAREFSGFVDPFDGVIDDVVYLKNYILDATERTEDYNSGAGVAFADWAGGGGGPTIPRGLSCIDSVYGATAGQVLIEA